MWGPWANVSKMSLGAYVYAIWREINSRYFSNQMSTKENFVENLRRLLKDKWAEFFNFQMIRKKTTIAKNLKLT